MKVFASESREVKAFVWPRGPARRCRKCLIINHDCTCFKPSSLLTKKERSCVVFAKSWLLNWWLSDNEEEESSESDDSNEEEMDVDDSFVFPDPEENPPLLAVDEDSQEEEGDDSMEEEEFDPNKAFIQYEIEVEQSEELPSFGFLIKNLVDQTQQ